MKPTEIIFKLPSSEEEIVALQKMFRDAAANPGIPHYYVSHADLQKVTGYSQRDAENGEPFHGFRGKIGGLSPDYHSEIEGIGDVYFLSATHLTKAGFRRDGNTMKWSRQRPQRPKTKPATERKGFRP